VNWAPPIATALGAKISGMEMYCLPQISAALYWMSIDTPIAVMRGARRGARRSGR
jgi:hypothetical protein